VPSAVAEMFGDTMLVNGTAYPFQEVNGMKRYRILNACNILHNDAPAPFPGGSRDFDSGSEGHEVKEGFSPNTRTALLFRRVAGTGQTIPIPMPAPGTTLVPILPQCRILRMAASS